MELLEDVDKDVDMYVDAPSAVVRASHDVARLRLVCLVRSGDGYVVRAVGTLFDTSGASDARHHVDITFGDAGDRSRAADLEAAVRQVQRWCEDGSMVALVEHPAGIALRSGDGTEIPLPRSA